MRTLGGSIGLAAGVIVFNQKIRNSAALANTLSQSDLQTVYKSPLIISTFNPHEQRLVATAFSTAFTAEMRVAMLAS